MRRSSSPARRIAIVGAGPAGTTLALGLLQQGYDVTLVSDRSPEQIRTGPVLSSQITFESALEVEAALGITDLLPTAPAIESLALRTSWADGAVTMVAPFQTPARSVDQRLRISTVMDEIERLGGKLVLLSAGVEDVEALAADHDLVVVSTGRGSLTALFAVDEARSPYQEPQRFAVLSYLRGLRADPEGPVLRHASVEGVGDCFTCAAVTADGTCDIVVLEAVPGGPLDRFRDVTPAAHERLLAEALAEHFPEVAARLAPGWCLLDGGTAYGAITPVVRRPVGTLPSGAVVLGMADAVVLNDPVTSQGANHALKSALFYLEAITGRREHFDAAWMQQTFDNFWRGWAQWATAWTNSWLRPLQPHQRTLLTAAAQHPEVAARIAAGFDDARLFSPWWFSAEAAERFVAEQTRVEASRFDPRDLRRALGQYATGVTVVTTEDAEGRRFAMTANSFTSVSLNPPIVLWAAAKSSPSLPAFERASHFAVNVLAADQHHLSRQFSTSGGDKFEGVELLPSELVADPSADDVLHPPVLAGTVAHFVCRTGQIVDAGDHLVIFGEIESYDAGGGEPLVFHSGSYRLAAKHPDL